MIILHVVRNDIKCDGENEDTTNLDTFGNSYRNPIPIIPAMWRHEVTTESREFTSYDL